MDWKPSDEEIVEYAQYLSVDLDKNPQYKSLMVEGLTAPLPEGWKIEEKGDDVLYISPKGQKQQDHPYDDIIRQKIQSQVQQQQSTKISKIQEVKILNKSEPQLKATLSEIQPLAIFKNILPTQDDINKAAIYFKILNITPSHKVLLVEFLTNKLEDWNIFKYKDTIFFQKNNISQWQHPLEDQYRKKFLALNLLETMKGTPPATTLQHTPLLRQLTQDNLETIQEQDEVISVIKMNLDDELNKQQTQIQQQVLSVSDLNLSQVEAKKLEKSQIYQQLCQEMINIKRQHAENIQHEIQVHRQEMEKLKSEHSITIDRLNKENKNEIEVSLIKQTQILKELRENLEIESLNLKNLFTIDLEDINKKHIIEKQQLNNVQNETQCLQFQIKEEQIKTQNLQQQLLEIQSQASIITQQLIKFQELSQLQIPSHLKSLFDTLDKQVLREKQVLSVEKAQIDALIAEFRLKNANKAVISRKIILFRDQQFEILQKYSLIEILKNSVKRSSQQHNKDSFSDFLHENDTQEQKAIDTIVEIILHDKYIKINQQVNDQLEHVNAIVNTPTRTPIYNVTNEDWLCQFKKGLQ
ncbi:hypothetical protein SS50377_23080 [Spironucleus salmonicida]|uniref:WW domain-containing protein n=1 Tax=Spironucleus salmonicida TaxID=348837 RepID=V6LSQ1_9EUKA|nr:hypothetical protein SS50377_23080 [Spironucleus salmonicida]|eukprot:EST47657.1 Hypothetical protein SS50377_12352 [Spironucleus salmonicida]